MDERLWHKVFNEVQLMRVEQAVNEYKEHGLYEMGWEIENIDFYLIAHMASFLDYLEKYYVSEGQPLVLGNYVEKKD